MRHTLLSLALLAAPAVVLADGFSYNYADVRYFHSEADSNGVNQQGAALSGAYGFGSSFFVQGNAAYGFSDSFSDGTTTGKFSSQSVSVSGGAHYPVTPVLDVLADVGVLYSRVSGEDGFKGNSKDDTGGIAEAGLRLALLSQLEAGAFYSYGRTFDLVDGDYKNAGAFKFDLQYHFTPGWSAVAAAQNGKAATTYSIGARYHF